MIDAWEALITFAKIFGLSGIWPRDSVIQIPDWKYGTTGKV